MIKLDISYQLTVDEAEKITKEERERRRKIRFQQVREMSKTNAARVRKAVTKTKEKELKKLICTINEDLSKEKSEKIAELKECYMQSINTIGHGQRLAAQQDDPEIAKHHLMKRYKKNVKLRHEVALSKLHDDKVTKYVRENKHIISRKAALEAEKERALRIASLPLPEQDIFEEVNQLLVSARKTKTVALHSQISYPPPAVVEKHDKKLVKDGHLVAQAQDLLLQEQQQQLKQTSEKQEHIQKERYQKALQIELLNRDSEKMMKEISFIQKKQTRQRQKNLAKIPKQVFLPPYKRQENFQTKQKLMEKDFEQIYVSNEAGLKSDLNILLEPHPPVETVEPTDSLDLTITSDLESIPVPTRQDHSTTMRDITNIPAAQKDREKSTLQSLFNRIKFQRNEWISGMTERLQYAEAGQEKTDKSDYSRSSQIPMSNEEGSSYFPVDEASASEPTHDEIGLIPSNDETGGSVARASNVHDGNGYEMKGTDSGSISQELEQPEIPEPVPRAFKLQQQIQQVMEQKKRIEEQRRKLEERLRNFDNDKHADQLSGYMFSPQRVAPLETKKSVRVSIDQTDSPTKQTFHEDQTANIKELLEHGRALIQSSVTHIKDSMELHQKDSSNLEFLPHLSSTTLGKHFPLTFVNLPDNISKVREYQKQLLQKHEEKLKFPLSKVETKIPSQNAVAATPVSSETRDTGDRPLLLSPPSTSFRLPFDQDEELVGVDVGSNYSRIRPNIPPSSTTSHEIQGSTPTSKLEQLFQSFKALKGLKPTSSTLTGKTETKYQEYQQQLDWLDSLLSPSASVDNMDPEDILPKEDIRLPSGTDRLESIGSQKPRQQYQQRQSGLLSPVPEKSGVPFYDVDLLNIFPEKDSESFHSEDNFQDSQRLSQYTDDDSTSYLTELLSSRVNGHTDTGYSSDYIWSHELIKNASNSNGRMESNQYSMQKQLSDIEEGTKLLCQQLSASNDQFDRQVETAAKLKEEMRNLATANLPGLQNVPEDSASQKKHEGLMDQRHPPIQRSAFINGFYPHELSAIEEAESILMTSCRSDNHRHYSSISPITVNRDQKKSDIQLDRSNGGDIPQHSRQDFDPSQTSISMDQAPTHLSSTGFSDSNDSSRTDALSPKYFNLWEGTSVSVSEKAEAEEDLGRNENHSTMKIWREILERSKSCGNSEDAQDLNYKSISSLSLASMKTENPEVNFDPLQCDPKSSETSSDEIKFPLVLPPESSTILPSSHLAAASESSLSEILSEGGSLSRELMDNHRDLSTFLSQLRLLVLKNQTVSINSLQTMKTKSDAMQNIAEDGAASFTDKLSCNSLHSTANATVFAPDNTTIPEADKNGEDQSEISKFALFHCSDKNVSIAATNGASTTFDSTIVNNITRQDSLSNIDSIPVLETSTPTVSVPENSFDLGEIIAPLLTKFKDRLLTNCPFRASSPISSLTHITNLPDSSSLSANQDSPPKTAAQCDVTSSLNTFPSLEKIRTAETLSPQEPTHQNCLTTHYCLPQTSTSTLSSLPLSHVTLYSSDDQSNTRTNQIYTPEPPELLSPTISQYSYSSSSSLDEIDTDDHQLLATAQNLCISDKPFLIPGVKEINLQYSKDQQPPPPQQQQQQQPILTSAPSDSMFYFNPCNDPESLSSSSSLPPPPPPPSSLLPFSTQVISQKSPGASQLLLNGSVKDQSFAESSVSGSTNRSQCTVVMRKVPSKKMSLGHSTSSPPSSSSSSATTLEKTNKADAMKSTSFANPAQVWSEIPPSKTASDAMIPSRNTKSADCRSSSSSSSLTQYSYSTSSPSASSSQEDLSTNSNATVPNPSKGPAMSEAKIFFNPLSNGSDVISQEQAIWGGDGPEADDANDGAWFSLLQEDISTEISNKSSTFFKHESLPFDISPINGSIHSESTDNTPDQYSSPPPLEDQQVMLQSTCKKENLYHQTLPNPMTLSLINSSSSPQPMSTSTATTQQSNGNNSSNSGENNSSSGHAVITVTSSSTLSGLSDLSLPSDIKQDYQVLLDQARSFMKRFKENKKRQNVSDSQANSTVRTPLQSNLPQQCKEPTVFQQQGPDITAFQQQGPDITTAFQQQEPNTITAFQQQGPNITAFQQQELTTAGATELQGVNAPTALEQQRSNIMTAIEQQGPIAPVVTELQGVDEAFPTEQLDPNDFTEMTQRHEISLKRFDSIFDQMQQSPVGILEEPDLSLVSSETLSNLEYGSN